MPRPGRSLLGDGTMMRVAGLLYLNPDDSRSLGEVASQLPTLNRLTVIRVLNDLVEQGYVVKSGTNPPRYRANERHYLYEELRSIAVKTLGGFEPLLQQIVSAPSVAYAAIYGSFARGTAGPSSDIDLLVVVVDAADPAVADIVSEIADAAHWLGREINPTIYDEREFAERRDEPFLRGVLAGPVIVLKDG